MQARSRITDNTASEVTAQRAFLDNFEKVVNRRVSGYPFEKTLSITKKLLSYASSEVDYSVRENIYVLPNYMNLSIRSGTVGYKNKILVSDGTFTLGKYAKVNTLNWRGDKPKIIHKAIVQPTITHKTLSHEENKVALVLLLTGGITMWFLFRGFCFDKQVITTSE